MSEPQEPTDPEPADPVATALGIDLRERAERLINAAEAFANAAVSLRRWATAGLAGGIVIVAAIAVLYAQQNASINSGHTTGHLIADCVTPGGDCYERGQQQTAALLALVNEQGIARGICLQENAKLEPIEAKKLAVEKCVAEQTG